MTIYTKINKKLTIKQHFTGINTIKYKCTTKMDRKKNNLGGLR